VHVGLLLTPNLRTSLISTHRSSSDRMTRFSDPVVVEHDLSAYPPAHKSWLWIPESLTNEQRCSSTFGIPRMASTCGCDPLCRHPALTSTPRWEYLTTLGFELDVIRRRRPYRWTIWVGNDGAVLASRHAP
jgi:hypothetical protein